MVENLGNKISSCLKKPPHVGKIRMSTSHQRCSQHSSRTKGARGHRRDPNCQFRPWTVRDGTAMVGWLLGLGNCVVG